MAPIDDDNDGSGGDGGTMSIMVMVVVMMIVMVVVSHLVISLRKVLLQSMLHCFEGLKLRSLLAFLFCLLFNINLSTDLVLLKVSIK